jgi:hypothetical protein
MCISSCVPFCCNHLHSPLAGTLAYSRSVTGQVDKTNLIMRGSAFSVKQVEFLLGNIDLLPEVEKELESGGIRGWTVQPGWQLGVPRKRNGCEDFVRVTLRQRSNVSATEDPQPYLPKAPLGLPEWVSEADQWVIKVLNFTVRQVRARVCVCVCVCVCVRLFVLLCWRSWTL